MTVEIWKWIAEKLGVPTLFLLLLCAAIYYMSSWTAEHIVTPVVDRHIEFLVTEQNSMKTIADQSIQQSQSVGKISEGLLDQKETMKRVIDNQGIIVESQKAISENLSNSQKLQDKSAKILEQIRDDQRKFPAVAERSP